jgi:hypothetical protein
MFEIDKLEYQSRVNLKFWKPEAPKTRRETWESDLSNTHVGWCWHTVFAYFNML